MSIVSIIYDCADSMATLYHVNAVIEQIRKNSLYGLGYYHQQLRIECAAVPMTCPYCCLEIVSPKQLYPLI